MAIAAWDATPLRRSAWSSFSSRHAFRYSSMAPISWPERWMGTTSACWGWPPSSSPGAVCSSSLTTRGRMAASAELSGSSSILRSPPRARVVRLYEASRYISALPALTRYIAPATAPMIRPAWVSATFRTSSSASDEFTAEAIASKRAARSRAPPPSLNATGSSRAVPCRRLSATLRRRIVSLMRRHGTARELEVALSDASGAGDRAALLLAMASAVNSSLALEEVLNVALTHAGRIMGAVAGAMYLVRAGNAEMYREASYNLSPRARGGLREIDEEPLSSAIGAMRPLVVKLDEHTAPGLELGGHPQHALVVPIQRSGQLMGAMELYLNAWRELTED